MSLHKTLLVGCVMLLSVAAYSSADYVAGQVWDFETMFSTSSNLGQQDSEGNTVWEYRYSNWDGGPASGGLMGAYHGWENPGTWQKTGDGNDGRIAPYYFQSNSGWEQCAVLAWVAPMDGVVNVSISMTGRDGPNAALFNIWPGQATEYSEGDVWVNWSWSMDNLAVSQGDKIVFKMATWGPGTVNFSNADMTVTLAPEPATMSLLGIGGLLAVLRKRR